MQDIKQPKQVYLWSTRNIKHVIDEHTYNKHVRYIHKWVEREMINRKHGRFVSRFEPLALRPRLHRNEEFPLKSISQDHSISQHLQWAPSRTLRPASPLLGPERTIRNTNPQARRGRNLYSSKYKYWILGDHFSWSPTNTLTNKDSYRMDIAIKGSSLYEKTR